MAGPWEKFKAKEEAPAGPWQKFAQKAEADADEANEQTGPGSARAAAEASAPRAVSDLAKKRPRNASDLRAMGKAALYGGAQAATFGHVPEIAGKLRQAFLGDDYLTARDETYRELNDAQAQAPMTFGLTNFLGNLVGPTKVKGAKSALGSAAKGFAVGAAQNPGAEEGVVDPLQIGPRAAIGTGGAILGGAMQGMANTAGQGGRSFMMKRRMQKPFFSKDLADEIDSAENQLRNHYIRPRDREANRVLRGKEVTLDPADFADPERPGLQAALEKRTAKAKKLRASQKTGGIAPPAAPEEGDNLVTIRGDAANRLRRRLEKDGYNQRTVYTDPKAKAGAQARTKQGQILREKRNQVAPELKENFEQQKYALDLIHDIRERSANPQEMMKSGSDTLSKMRDVDHLSGSTNLVGLGRDLRGANFLAGTAPTSDLPHYMRGPVRWTSNAAAAMGVPVSVGQAMTPRQVRSTLNPALLRSLIQQAMQGPEYAEEEFEGNRSPQSVPNEDGGDLRLGDASNNFAALGRVIESEGGLGGSKIRRGDDKWLRTILRQAWTDEDARVLSEEQLKDMIPNATRQLNRGGKVGRQ